MKESFNNWESGEIIGKMSLQDPGLSIIRSEAHSQALKTISLHIFSLQAHWREHGMNTASMRDLFDIPLGPLMLRIYMLALL